MNEVDDLHFKLIVLDDETTLGSLDLDDFQLVLDAEKRQIRINLSGAQIQEALRILPASRLFSRPESALD